MTDRSKLLWFVLRLCVLAALAGNLAGCNPADLAEFAAAQQQEGQALELSPTPFSPLFDPSDNRFSNSQITGGDVIGAANAQALNVETQIQGSQAQTFSWLPGDEQVALAVEQGLMVYSVGSNTVIDHLETTQPDQLTSAQKSRRLAWVDQDNTIQVVEADSFQPVGEIPGATGAVTSLSLSPQGGFLAFATFDQKIQVWEAQPDGLKMVRTWELPHWLSDLTFSPQGDQLAAANLAEFTVYFFDPHTGKEIRSLAWSEHASPALYAVQFSPDWKYLAWVARGSVLIMDVASGQTLAALEHEDFISAVAWSGDSSLLAVGSAGTDGGQMSPMVYLWAVDSGRLVNRLPTTGSVLSLSFSPDGRELGVLSDGGALQVWGIAP